MTQDKFETLVEQWDLPETVDQKETPLHIMEQLAIFLDCMYYDPNADDPQKRVWVNVEGIPYRDYPKIYGSDRYKVINIQFAAIGMTPSGRRYQGSSTDFPARVMLDLEIYEALPVKEEEGKIDFCDLSLFAGEITGGLFMQRIPGVASSPISHEGGEIEDDLIIDGNHVTTAFVLTIAVDCLLNTSMWLNAHRARSETKFRPESTFNWYGDLTTDNLPPDDPPNEWEIFVRSDYNPIPEQLSMSARAGEPTATFNLRATA